MSQDRNKCPDCGTSPGDNHYAGCDQEICPRHQLQRITCSCGPLKDMQEHAPRVPVGFVAGTSQQNLWMEFMDDTGRHCGLCANVGKIPAGEKRMPNGELICRSERYCICPNGRVMKKKMNEKGVYLV